MSRATAWWLIMFALLAFWVGFAALIIHFAGD